MADQLRAERGTVLHCRLQKTTTPGTPSQYFHAGIACGRSLPPLVPNVLQREAFVCVLGFFVCVHTADKIQGRLLLECVCVCVCVCVCTPVGTFRVEH
jgi:hypothetical protein